jgi:hypothetical protein
MVLLNLDHISTVRPLAQSLHHSFFTSSDQFKSIQNDLGALMSILQAIEGEHENLDAHWISQPELNRLITNCHEILKDLQGLKIHYDSVGTQTQRTWERELWRKEDFTEIRARLTTTINSLSIMFSTVMQ